MTTVMIAYNIGVFTINIILSCPLKNLPYAYAHIPVAAYKYLLLLFTYRYYNIRICIRNKMINLRYFLLHNIIIIFNKVG